jgi:hypothetical protein
MFICSSAGPLAGLPRARATAFPDSAGRRQAGTARIAIPAIPWNGCTDMSALRR